MPSISSLFKSIIKKSPPPTPTPRGSLDTPSSPASPSSPPSSSAQATPKSPLSTSSSTAASTATPAKAARPASTHRPSPSLPSAPTPASTTPAQAQPHAPRRLRSLKRAASQRQLRPRPALAEEAIQEEQENRPPSSAVYDGTPATLPRRPSTAGALGRKKPEPLSSSSASPRPSVERAEERDELGALGGFGAGDGRGRRGTVKRWGTVSRKPIPDALSTPGEGPAEGAKKSRRGKSEDNLMVSIIAAAGLASPSISRSTTPSTPAFQPSSEPSGQGLPLLSPSSPFSPAFAEGQTPPPSAGTATTVFPVSSLSSGASDKEGTETPTPETPTVPALTFTPSPSAESPEVQTPPAGLSRVPSAPGSSTRTTTTTITTITTGGRSIAKLAPANNSAHSLLPSSPLPVPFPGLSPSSTFPGSNGSGLPSPLLPPYPSSASYLSPTPPQPAAREPQLYPESWSDQPETSFPEEVKRREGRNSILSVLSWGKKIEVAYSPPGREGAGVGQA